MSGSTLDDTVAVADDTTRASLSAKSPDDDKGVSDTLLSRADVGASVTLSGVLGGRRVSRNLSDLGLRVGQNVVVQRRLISGGVAVRTCDMTVAIGSSLARQVMVRPTCCCS